MTTHSLHFSLAIGREQFFKYFLRRFSHITFKSKSCNSYEREITTFMISACKAILLVYCALQIHLLVWRFITRTTEALFQSVGKPCYSSHMLHKFGHAGAR